MPTDVDVQPAAVPLLDGWQTEEEVAAEIGCHRRTLARYRNLPGGLPFMRVAGRVYVRRSDVRDFFERRIERPNPVRKSRA